MRRAGGGGSVVAVCALLLGLAALPSAAAPAAATATVNTATTAGATTAGATNAGAAVPVAAAASPDGAGFWEASTDGAVSPEGGAASYGDASGYPLAAPVVSIAATPSGHGYWLLGSDGGVFSFGDAGFHGSTGGMHLAQPALSMVATPTGNGYWFVARDGGVFAFGDAGFHGSMGGLRLSQPVVGMAATPDGGGYWLVARDGGVFAFGDAGFHGSTGGLRLSQPVVGMAATPDGGGYWLVARDGGIFSFGDAHFYGSSAGAATAPAIGLVATRTGHGYWIILGNGQARAFGDAASVSHAPVPSAGFSLVGEVVGIDPGHNGGNGSDPAYIDQPVWNGRSYEACDTVGAATDAGYPESSFNFDVATRLAAILRSYGATVVLTRHSNAGVGPCITTRAAIVNDGGNSDVGIDIHADGGPPGGRGVAVLEPVADGPDNAVIGSSARLAVDVRNQFEAATGEPSSSYDGVGGLQPRNDLAGLNLTTVPKVLIECANMRNPTDANLVTDPAWRQKAAQGLAQGLSLYLIGYP